MNVHAEKRIINFYPFFHCEDARRRSGGFWMLSYIFENIKNHIIQHQFLLRFYCFSFQYSFYGFLLLFSQHWMPEKYLPLTSSELGSGKTSEWYCLVKRLIILKKKAGNKKDLSNGRKKLWIFCANAIKEKQNKNFFSRASNEKLSWKLNLSNIDNNNIGGKPSWQE